MINSYELFCLLKEHCRADEKDKYWWPNSGSFEVVIGAVLTQRTKWHNVEKSLVNLKKENLLNLEKIASLSLDNLSLLIKPSGFYNTKAKRLKLLCQNILQDFKNYEDFKENVSRQWLLSQNGIGEETADSILCYALYKEVLVVDSYTNRLLKHFGYEFETYAQIQEWCEQGIYENLERIKKIYGFDISLVEIFARFHGKIVIFMSQNMLAT